MTSENGSTNDNHEFISEEYVTLQEEEQPIDLQGRILKGKQFYKQMQVFVVALTQNYYF